MIHKQKTAREHLPIYLIPFVLGMAGLLFARDLDNSLLKGIVGSVSVAVPLFAGGHFLSRMRSKRVEKFFLLLGVVMLIMGAIAVAGLSVFPTSLQNDKFESVPRQVLLYSLWIGGGSLGLGLITILYSVLRTGVTIREFSDRFGYLAESISEGFALTTSDGIILVVNRQFLEMTGLTKMELVGQDVIKVRLLSQVIIEMRIKDMDHIEGETAWNVDDTESHFRISCNPVLNRRGTPDGMLVTLCDISEERRMAYKLEHYTQGLQHLVEEQTQKLRESENRLRSLLQHMNEGFLTLNSTFKICFANDRVCDLLDTSEEDLSGTDIFDLIISDEKARLLSLLKLASSQQDSRTRQEFSVLKNNKMVPVMIAVTPIGDFADKQQRYSLVITDITELKQVQRQLQIRADELQNLNEELRMHDHAKDVFLSNVTHELRTPLSTVQGYIEMLNSGSLGKLEAPGKAALKVAERNIDRLTGLINEMINFSRMEIRGLELKIGLFDIIELVQESVSSQHPQAIAKDICLQIRPGDDMCPVWGDRGKIGQVLMNLLSNAIKFSKDGTQIHITVSRRNGNDLALAVTDTGIGIKSEHYERVFSKFFQVDSALNRRYNGTGIGLSVAKSITEAHNGTIEIDSEYGQGSTFTMLLPNVVFDCNCDVKQKTSVSVADVLLAESKEEFSDALTECLNNCGFDVIPANDGHDCIQIAEKRRPDLIIIDEILPDMPGIAAIESLRDSEAANNIPTILLQQEILGSESSILRRLTLPANVSILTKPFTPEELIENIRDVRGDKDLDATDENAEDEYGDDVVLIGQDRDYLDLIATSLRIRQIKCRVLPNIKDIISLSSNIMPSIVFVEMNSPESEFAEFVQKYGDSRVFQDVPIYLIANTTFPEEIINGFTGILHKPFPMNEIVTITEDIIDNADKKQDKYDVQIPKS